MGYFIKFLPNKKSVPNWKVQFVSYKKIDTQNSKSKKPKREWDIPKSRWRSLGFYHLMSIDEARARAKQINAQLHLKRQEEQIKIISEEQRQTQLRFDSVLPTEFVAEFENRFIRKSDSQTQQGLRKNSRAYTAWRAAQKLIINIKVEPSDWYYYTNEVYEFFYQQRYSFRYILTILRMANLWGYFICRKFGRPFLQVTPPRGYERQRLIEINYEKRDSVARASKPMEPAVLEKAKDHMNLENFNWIFLSVWLGLRPKEVDSLHDEKFWRLETLGNGRKIIWVFQTKIVALPPEDRWKPIPILFDEQNFALRILESKQFQRPLTQTMRRHFGAGVTLYGGRKGFSDLMLSKGHSFENISIWMGHSSLQRTWRSYKNRRKFHLTGY
jgi:hypothetical protein